MIGNFMKSGYEISNYRSRNHKGFSSQLIVVLLLVLGIGSMTGCKTQPYKSPDRLNPHGTKVKKLEGTHDQKVGQLAFEITQMNESILLSEARTVADTSIRVSEELRESYKVFGPPLMHNFLVNTGIKNRGLCFQWAEDIYPHLVALNLQSLDTHLAVALRGHLREHSAIVITPKGHSFYDGIVLDPWRYSGRLAWVHVQNSRYPWRPFDEQPPEMIEAWQKFNAAKKPRESIKLHPDPNLRSLGRIGYRF